MLWSMRMAADKAVRRVRHLAYVLSYRHGTGSTPKFMSTSADGKSVNIGDVSMPVRTPKHPELVPRKYLPKQIPQSVLQHLRWIMQKDLLGQDVFLIGAPGPLRRTLAMMYLELTKKELEYVSLSRDTTETDLKQRREIVSGTAYHIDQCAVRAAVEGRVLVLEGIEKAERNVLPVLNNLLENREMQLDDGHFLMAADRYDKLLQEHTKEELDAWKLVRVSEQFRVIALGLPVPRYQGNPLDPPLRSRFQARDINPLPFKDQMDLLSTAGEGVGPEKLSQMLSVASTLRSSEANTMGMPDFPMDNLPAVIKIMSEYPGASPRRLLATLYPHDVMLGKEGRTAVEDVMKNFELNQYDSKASVISELRRGPDGATVELSRGSRSESIQVRSGTLMEPTPASQNFVSTPYHEELLADMMQCHLVKDLCIIGPRGCGKSVVTKQFADLLGYHLEQIMLYQDMTSRDLLQQRMTKPNGDTAWRPSPLVTAALEGSLAVLDGVHRVNPGTFAVLHRLIHDRELTLFDGTRIVRPDRYESYKETTGLSDQEMKERGILCIHPAFRIVALAEPPVLGSSSQQWLNSEVLTMFLFHDMRGLSKEEELEVLHKLVPNMTNMQPLMALTHKLRQATDSSLKSIASSLSSRQLLRVARRLAQYPNDNIYDTVQKACLGRFLPRLTRKALEEELEQLDIKKPEQPFTVEKMERAITCGVQDGVLRIGNTEVPVYNPENKMKVPDVLFYENVQHLHIMEDMLKDFMLGEHLLLVGNQGVGKNKIVDRFLYLLNRPREYLQLHRDTTVQTLTLQPTVQDGVIVYEDSPLVRAVKYGSVLVIDEADKAPTNVTCILKTLVESGEMHLADGRRIVSASSGLAPSANILVAHPDFRMIVLANRPGFPFLGNDFFGAMGDIFSCHAVDNPDMESEMSMLRQYGPEVPEDILRKLVLAFGELRDMADQGLISYPYSTREVVNMVKHLQKFPSEGLASVVRNVFDFDSYNKELTDTVIETMHKHGIPVGADPANINLGRELPLPKFEFAGQLHIKSQGQRKQTKLMSCPVEDKHLRIKGPVKLNVQSYGLERHEARSLLFSEQEAFWTLPLYETSIILNTAVSKAAYRQPSVFKDDLIHVATSNPISLYTMNPRSQHLTCIDLYDIFPTIRSSYRPRIHLAPLGFPLDESVVLHEEVSNIVLSVNTVTGDITRLETATMLEAAADKITRSFRSQQGQHKMCSQFAHEPDGMLLFYKEKGQSIDVVNMLEGRCHEISLPILIQSVNMLSKETWLLTEADSLQTYLLSQPEPMEYVLQHMSGQDGIEGNLIGQNDMFSTLPLAASLLSKALDQQITSPNRVSSSQHTYATIAVGLPDLTTVDLHVSPRVDQNDEPQEFIKKTILGATQGRRSDNTPIVYLPESGQVVRALPTWKVPKEVFPQGVKPQQLSGYLEVSDIVSHKLRYIPIPGVINTSAYSAWMHSSSDINLAMAGMSEDGLVTVDSGGCVRLWETALVNLERSIQQWRNLIGDPERPLQITYDQELRKQAESPKHGKVDPKGAPHVGGNTWAGGTGGRDTAGLGGLGGPYRLDAGHDVHQVSQMDKDAVPEEVRKAAREMGLKAWKQRLKEIQMSEFDGELYDRYAAGVRKQIQSLRVILDALQAKGKERQWLKHQTQGDLDEAKLIEGLTGEKAIYKRRGEKDPEMGSPQEKPKLLRLLVDVSGSMYRFNGYDGRLERQLEATLMVMEALENYEHKIKYDIVGHSGEGPNFEMVASSKPPANNKERLDVLKVLHAHSQFCISGDHTLEATAHAIKKIAEQDADEHFVIVLSDANLERYGIRPEAFADVLTSDEDVNAYAIFIGSLGDQASRLIKKLPAGKAFLCMDTKNLPQILQQIFTSTMLSTK